jgi:hypothetical protein
VASRRNRPIEDHFDMTFELEVALEQAGKQELLDVKRPLGAGFRGLPEKRRDLTPAQVVDELVVGG